MTRTRYPLPTLAANRAAAAARTAARHAAARQTHTALRHRRETRTA